MDSLVLTYEEFLRQAEALASTLERFETEEGPPLTAVFAYRSVAAYVAVLATLLRGHGYVPLNRTFPVERSKTMLERAGCRAIIVDRESEAQLEGLLAGRKHSLLLVFPDHENSEELQARYPQHKVIGKSSIERADHWKPREVQPDRIAYLLFTSGSTGIPKGVMVSHSNVISFIDAIVERYKVSPDDRLSQTFDMTFDLSVFDMFVAWECGACVCCLPQKALINPGRFINEKELTIWFSVPSTGVFMKKLGALKSRRYPSLRLSLFCGEPLPVEIAHAWQNAAPNSFVENLYGPTEATIACMVYRWDPTLSPSVSLHGVVPIGMPLNGMKTVIVDESMAEVSEGAEGELLLCGPQVTLGYWQDPDRTRDSFVSLRGLSGTFYRTGDRVRRPRGGAPMTYLGRVDHQIKIHGHRVELGEVESVIRHESGESAVIALGWPVSVSGAGGIVAFIGQKKLDVEKLKTRLSARLPEYMIPREIRLLNALPLNPNGKFDRKALLGLLEDEE